MTARIPISLELPVGDDEGAELGQFIADVHAECPYERAVGVLAHEALLDALKDLSFAERRVLELCYGLGGERPRTLDEVGLMFKVTRGRVRQIEHRSLKKLRKAQKLRALSRLV